ncbi:MAG: biotin--[acetyl-CoA-carboxylase] ligase [Bacteroidetes bacterium]|nr:biotin--[acetyl-CoA-carboxylase] ligase [Bacteroidota bacterium]
MFISLFSENHIIRLKSITSTNDYASGLVKSNNPAEGTVIWANSQTAGKGQKGNSWESEADKNLTFSFILHPVLINPSEQFLLNKAISLGITDYLKTKINTLAVKIKWPNDIYAGEKKIAGILIENEILGNTLETAIVGIGLNINQLKFSDKIPNPTSLALITGMESDLQHVLFQVLYKIQDRIINFYNNDIESINDDYLNDLLYFKIYKKYYYNNREIEAMIMDVSEFGELILRTKEEEVIKCSFKEIVFLHS